MLAAIRRIYQLYGFEAVETPAIEYTEALGKFLPDADRPNEGVLALQDDDKQWMALRYDLTAPLARFAAEHWDFLPKPFRRYAVGPVWRNEKPGPGRYREFVQCDADTVGSARPEADAEMVAMAVEALEAIGLPQGAAVVRINNRKFSTACCRASRSRLRRAARRAAGGRQVGPAGRRWRSAAARRRPQGEVRRFHQGRRPWANAIEAVLAFTAARRSTNAQTLTALTEIVATSPRGMEGVKELRAIDELARAADYNESRLPSAPARSRLRCAFRAVTVRERWPAIETVISRQSLR